MTTRAWGFVLAFCASAGVVASCSIDRERKMFPSGGPPGGAVGIGGTVEGDPPPNLDLGGASSLIDMAPPVLATDLASTPARDFGPEFLDLYAETL